MTVAQEMPQTSEEEKERDERQEQAEKRRNHMILRARGQKLVITERYRRKATLGEEGDVSG